MASAKIDIFLIFAVSVMKNHVILTILSVLFATTALMAQEQPDSVARSRHDIFTTMPGNVVVNQPESVERKFEEYFQVDQASGQIKRFEDENAAAKSGQFRIRIYSNSAQNSRNESTQALSRFQRAFPDIPAVRTFTSPFYKVTVGNYATRAEAQKALNEIKGSFPAAYIVRGN